MLSDQAKGWMRDLSLYGAICIVGLLSYLVLSEAHRITDRIGQIGMNIISRLMGLVLATMSVQFIVDGMTAAVRASFTMLAK